MNENILREQAPGEGLSAFQKLEAQARRLEGSIFFLVALIALLPASCGAR